MRAYSPSHMKPGAVHARGLALLAANDEPEDDERLTCPPWMPNTGSELERAQRAVRAGWLPKLTAEARERFTKLIAEAAQ